MDLSWLKPTEKKIFWTIVFFIWDLGRIFYRSNFPSFTRLILIVLFTPLLAYIFVCIITLYGEKYTKAVQKGKIKETKFSNFKGILVIIGMIVYILLGSAILSIIFPDPNKLGTLGILFIIVVFASPFIILLYHSFRSLPK